MKIRRLDLIAYGPFQNQSLVFESNGLQIVFGPNEAGKSTALRALQAALYGLTEKRDAFLHPWDMMRVGLSIETADGIVRVERRKGRGARSLVYTGTDRAVTAEEWNRLLPVQTPELFQQMFGLDYPRLVEGGQELAAGKGDIGQALLAAGGDLGKAVERMRRFQARADDLFQSHARSQSKLAVALRQYKDAERRIRSERFSSHAYRTAVRELEACQQEQDRLTDEIVKCAAEQQRLTRLRQAAPGVALLARKEGDLAGMSEVRSLSADFAERHEKSVMLLGNAVTTAENSRAELLRLTGKREAIRQEPALAGLKPEIERLFAQSGKIDAARKDRPKREGEVQQLRERVARHLRLLGLDPDPAGRAGLCVTEAQRAEIGRLSEEHPKLATRLEEATKAIEALHGDLGRNRLELEDLPEPPDTSEIERLLTGRGGVPGKAEPDKLRIELEAADSRADANLKALPLFRGTGEGLERLTAPLPATVRAFQSRYAGQEAAEATLAAEEHGAREEIAALGRKIRQLEGRGEVPTESDLAGSRTRRDLGWTAVKRRWLAGEPDAVAEAGFLSADQSGQPLDAAYEEAVLHADRVSDGLRLEVGRVEKKALWLEELARSKRKLDQAGKRMGELAGVRLDLEREWRELWEPVSITPLPPVEMLDWLDRRRQVVEELRDAAGLRRLLAGIEEESRTWGEEARTALRALGVRAEGSPDALAAIGRGVVERASGARAARRDLEKERKRLEIDQAKTAQRQSELEKALAGWSRRWAAAIAGLPVSAEATPDEVRKVVGLLDEAAADSERIESLTHRIEAMLNDDEGFSAEVRRIAERAGLATEREDALIVMQVLHKAAATARQNEDAGAALGKDIERIRETLGRAEGEAARLDRQLAALCAEAGVDERDRLRAAIEQSSRKRDLAKQVEEQRRALVPACAGGALEALIETVRALDLDAVPAQLADLKMRQQECENQRQACSRRAVELEQEFQLHESADSLSRAAAEKQGAGARIVELAEEHLEQAIAARLMTAAIERYRARHQDPLLERAGQQLERLTRGSFTGLAVDFDEAGRRVLRAIRKGSAEHVDVAGLSDGARDQLFFALRLAYIEDYTGRVGPSPVILDDVLMAFDDERATAALRVLCELAGRTQVLLFTHHAHHVELARLGLEPESVTVHQLAPARVAAAR